MIVAQFRTFYQPSFKPMRQAAVASSSPLDSLQLPASEEDYWHARYTLEPYFVAGRGFDQYRPAYLLGWYAGISGKSKQTGFDALEADLRSLWLKAQGSSWLDWSQARDAVKAAWERTAVISIKGQLTEPLSVSDQRNLTQVMEAGYRFRECACTFLETASSSMAVDALRRFSLECQKLLGQLEELVERSDATVLAPKATVHSGFLERTKQAWRNSGFGPPIETMQDVLERLRVWLESSELMAEQSLPARLVKMLKHHVLVLRGHMQALRWLSHGSD